MSPDLPESSWHAPVGGIDARSPFRAPCVEGTAADPTSHCGWARLSDAIVTASYGVGMGTAAAFTLSGFDGTPFHGASTMHAEPGIGYAGGLAVVALSSTLVKVRAARPRPYTYSPNFRPGDDHACGAYRDVYCTDANHSFYSLHTAFTAWNLFYAASAFDLYAPRSQWKPGAVALGYTLATVSTVVVGEARVHAGMHFWSDVAVGAVVGAGIGLAAPRIAELTPDSWGGEGRGGPVVFSFSGGW